MLPIISSMEGHSSNPFPCLLQLLGLRDRECYETFGVRWSRRSPDSWPDALNSVDVHGSRPNDHVKQSSSFTTSIVSLGVMSPLSDIHDGSPDRNLALSHKVNRACQGCARLATLPETLAV